MPIRTSKSKLYRKIQVVNNIHRQFQFLSARSMKKKNLPHRCQLKISYITILRHCLTTCPGRNADHDMPRSGLSPTTCTGLNAVLRHALVGRHLLDMPCSRHSLRHAWLGRSLKTCPSRDAVLQHALVRTQF